jgi:hypothetical protein
LIEEGAKLPRARMWKRRREEDVDDGSWSYKERKGHGVVVD